MLDEGVLVGPTNMGHVVPLPILEPVREIGRKKARDISLSVVTFNTQSMLQTGRQKHLADLFASFAVDVLCLQEDAFAWTRL